MVYTPPTLSLQAWDGDTSSRPCEMDLIGGNGSTSAAAVAAPTAGGPPQPPPPARQRRHSVAAAAAAAEPSAVAAKGRRPRAQTCYAWTDSGGGGGSVAGSQKVARLAFDLADARGMGQLRPEDVANLVPKAKKLEAFSKHVTRITTTVVAPTTNGGAVPPSEDDTSSAAAAAAAAAAAPQQYIVTKEAFVRHAEVDAEFLALLRMRLEVELNPRKKAAHAEWLLERKTRACRTLVIREDFGGEAAKLGSVAVTMLPSAGSTAAGNDKGSSGGSGSEEGQAERGRVASDFFLSGGRGSSGRDGERGDEEGSRSGTGKVKGIVRTFMLLFVPAGTVLTSLVFFSKWAGSGVVCSAECDCSDSVLSDLIRHVLVGRLPFDFFLHLYTAHLFSSMSRLGDGWLTSDLVLPLISSTLLEAFCLTIAHLLFDGITPYAEHVIGLMCAIAPVMCFALHRRCWKRGAFATSPLVYVLAVLTVINGLKNIVISTWGAQVILMAWPVVVFILQQLCVLCLNVLLDSINQKGKITFRGMGGMGDLVPERQILHVAVALDVFSDAVRALLVLTIDSTYALVLNLTLTVVIEAITRNNLQKWVLSWVVRPCFAWTPSPTPLEDFMNASQLYAGYMPFTGLAIMYVADYFPWGVDFIDCKTRKLELPGSYTTFAALFGTEVLCSVLSLLVHTRLKCLLPKHLQATQQLAPLIQLRGFVQCGLLALALSSLVLYGFTGSGDIAMAAQRYTASQDGSNSTAA